MSAVIIAFPRSPASWLRDYDRLLGRITMALNLSAALLKRAEAARLAARAEAP